jgi:hypothetical protein
MCNGKERERMKAEYWLLLKGTIIVVVGAAMVGVAAKKENTAFNMKHLESLYAKVPFLAVEAFAFLLIIVLFIASRRNPKRYDGDRSGILLFFGYAAGWALAQQNLLIKSVLEITKAMQTGAAAPLTWTFYLIVAIAAVLTFVGIFLIDSGLQSYDDGTCCGVVGLWGCVGG